MLSAFVRCLLTRKHALPIRRQSRYLWVRTTVSHSWAARHRRRRPFILPPVSC